MLLPTDAEAEEATASAEARGEHPGVLGNAPGVRYRGDASLSSLPAYEAPFSSALVDCARCVGSGSRSTWSSTLKALAADALPALALRLSHGGHAALLFDLERSGGDNGADQLPSQADVEAALSPLPLSLVSFSSSGGASAGGVVLRCSAVGVVRVPHNYALPAGPLRLSAPVVRGFGRGSTQLGFPTANLDPGVIGLETLQSLRRGVYFGWATRPSAAAGGGDNDGAAASPAGVPPLPCVLNVGVRPTVEGTAGGDLTVEAHLMDWTGQPEFYGENLRVLVLGFIRPEARFSGIIALKERIAADIGVARAVLASPECAAAAGDPFLKTG